MSKRQEGRLRWLRHAVSFEDRVRLTLGRRLSGREAAYARKVIGRWKRRATFKDGAFASWLAQAGIDEYQLAAMVRLPATRRIREHVRCQQTWRQFRLLEARSGPTPRFSPCADGHQGLLHLAQPLIEETLTQLESDLAILHAGGGAQLFEFDHVCTQLAKDASRQVLYLIQKTCLLELRVASVRGELAGDDSEERYRSFTAWLGTAAGRKAVFSEYPLLLDAVVTRLGMFRRNMLQIFTDLVADAPEVERVLLDGRKLGKLKGWSTEAGDSHRGARTVATLVFDDDVRLVYKPRSLRIDLGFNRLLDWCNERLPDRPLRGTRTVDRSTHGWCEFISHHELDSALAAEDFYHRQGKFLALFYALHAGDLHFENMIACGADPVYIDLETLFQTPLFHPGQEDGVCRDGWPMTVADTLIIPSGQVIPEVRASVPDFSIFGAKPGQEMNARALKLVNAGTDRASLQAEDMLFDERRHIPTLNGDSVSADAHVNCVMRGFEEMYELIRTHAAFLISREGIPEFFAGSEVRTVFRPTHLYASLVGTSLHPDYLSEALERRMFFEQLYVDDADCRWQNRLLASEVEDMQNLDVPFFWRLFDECTVRNSSGEIVAEFEWPSPREIVCGQIASMSGGDMRAQLALIESALIPVTEASNVKLAESWPNRSASRTVHEARSDATFSRDVAIDLAERFMSTLICREGDRYWLCKTMSGNERLTSSPGVVDLYDGQLGIALFLGWASRVSGNKAYADTALAAIRTVQRWTRNGSRYFSSLGVFSGALGIPYVLASLGTALDRRELHEEAIAWLEEFDPDRHKNGLDIISGAAGGILFLASLMEGATVDSAHSLRLLPLMEHLADRIVAQSVRQTVGIGWTPAPPNKQALTGFAHGTAGYAAALYTAARCLDAPAYRHAARAAIAYENSHFLPAQEGWVDLRERGPANHGAAQKKMSAWCSGGTGILLGRLIALGSDPCAEPDCEVLLTDAANAARVALSEHEMTSVGNVSLCHGALGNLEILERAANVRGLVGIVNAKECREWIHREHVAWRCGDEYRSPVQSTRAAPSLMNGLAGIGYGLLRHLAPSVVPSVLFLEISPRQSRLAPTAGPHGN